MRPWRPLGVGTRRQPFRDHRPGGRWSLPHACRPDHLASRSSRPPQRAVANLVCSDDCASVARSNRAGRCRCCAHGCGGLPVGVLPRRHAVPPHARFRASRSGPFPPSSLLNAGTVAGNHFGAPAATAALATLSGLPPHTTSINSAANRRRGRLFAALLMVEHMTPPGPLRPALLLLILSAWPWPTADTIETLRSVATNHDLEPLRSAVIDAWQDPETFRNHFEDVTEVLGRVLFVSALPLFVGQSFVAGAVALVFLGQVKTGHALLGAIMLGAACGAEAVRRRSARPLVLAIAATGTTAALMRLGAVLPSLGIVFEPLWLTRHYPELLKTYGLALVVWAAGGADTRRRATWLRGTRLPNDAAARRPGWCLRFLRAVQHYRIELNTFRIGSRNQAHGRARRTSTHCTLLRWPRRHVTMMAMGARRPVGRVTFIAILALPPTRAYGAVLMATAPARAHGTRTTAPLPRRSRRFRLPEASSRQTTFDIPPTGPGGDAARFRFRRCGAIKLSGCPATTDIRGGSAECCCSGRSGRRARRVWRCRSRRGGSHPHSHTQDRRASGVVAAAKDARERWLRGVCPTRSHAVVRSALGWRGGGGDPIARTASSPSTDCGVTSRAA